VIGLKGEKPGKALGKEGEVKGGSTIGRPEKLAP